MTMAIAIAIAIAIARATARARARVRAMYRLGHVLFMRQHCDINVDRNASPHAAPAGPLWSCPHVSLMQRRPARCGSAPMCPSCSAGLPVVRRQDPRARAPRVRVEVRASIGTG